MKFLKKLKSGNFWVSLISAGVLIAEGIFDIEIKTEYLNQIVLGLMGLLTVFGIVSDHGESETVVTTKSLSESTMQTNENDEINSSNIRSICDTVNLLLNKVSINSNQENSDTHNELITVLHNFLNEKTNSQFEDKIEEVENSADQIVECEASETQDSLEMQEIDKQDFESLKTKENSTQVESQDEIQLIN